jgi:2-C-methyl-D-erythritol 4-phosphate cytidylyltransferase
VELAGRPLVAWCLEAFVAAETVDRIVVAAPHGFLDEIGGLVPDGIETTVVTGGDSRSESVAAALNAATSEFVAVHDAARPLVSPELIDAVLVKLASRPDADGVIAAAPLTDTVKRAREPRPARGGFETGGPTIAKTESRDHLWAAQTPQAFRADSLRSGLAADPQRVAAATDDAMLVENAGGKVLIEPAPTENLKVTTPADLRVAALLLANRR